MAEMNTQVLSDRELLESISYRLGKIERREKVRTAKNWIIAIVIVGLLAAAAIIIVPKVQAAVAYYNRIVSKANEVVAMVESVDFEKVRGLVDSVEQIDADRINEIIGQVSSIDFDALKEKVNAIANIDLSSITAEISTILTRLSYLTRFF